MSSDRIESLLSALTVAVHYAADQRRAGRVLESALRGLVNPEGVSASPVAPNADRRDALGAPVSPYAPPEWDDLRVAVREVASQIGWSAAARRFGGDARHLKDLVYRTRAPGAGRQARLMRVVGTTRH